jgi:hypothetical protein
MDRRKLDKLVGLKTDIDEILEGSHLYASAPRIFPQIYPVSFSRIYLRRFFFLRIVFSVSFSRAFFAAHSILRACTSRSRR